MQFHMVYEIKSNVHLLYSFIHIFIHNSITKCFGKSFAKPLAKAFRKISIISELNIHQPHRASLAMCIEVKPRPKRSNFFLKKFVVTSHHILEPLVLSVSDSG